MHPSLGNYPELQQAIRRAETLRSALSDAGNTADAERLSQAISAAAQLRLAVGVVGRTKTGKSTLINAILGRTDDLFAPVDKEPATNVVTCYVNAPREVVRVVRHTDAEDAPGMVISSAEIRCYACEKYNPGNRELVKAIEVSAPFPVLGKDLVLVDTPGADNALTNAHDVVLLDVLPRLDAVIFLAPSGRPLDEAQIRLLEQVRKNDIKKFLFAVTMVDKTDVDELAQAMSHNRNELAKRGISVDQIPICARKQQETGSDPGTQQLITAVQEMVSKGRVATIVERLNDLSERCMAAARLSIATQLAVVGETQEEIAAEQKALENARRSLKFDRPQIELKFQKLWYRAFDVMTGALPGIESTMRKEYEMVIQKTPDRQITMLGKTIHTDVLQRLYEHLEPHVKQLKASLSEACRAVDSVFARPLDIGAKHASAIVDTRLSFAPAFDAATATIPSLLGAFGLASLPGLVSSACLATAPAVAWYNPFTWLASGVAGASGTAASALLAPLAAIGAPVLIGAACYKCFTTWKGRMAQTKNALSLAVNDLISQAISKTCDNLRDLKEKHESILAEFIADADAQLAAQEARFALLLEEVPSPERVQILKSTLLLLDSLDHPPAIESTQAPVHRLF